jgi:hypothetical protein
MYRHALWRVYANEHLRTAGTRQSHLDVDKGSVVKGLVMSAMMERLIRPIPKHITANSHVASYNFSFIRSV